MTTLEAKIYCQIITCHRENAEVQDSILSRMEEIFRENIFTRKAFGQLELHR